MLKPLLLKNDKKARLLIGLVSVVVFVAVAVLSKVKLNVDLGFNVHVFAFVNALLNSMVAFLLLMGLLTIKRKNFQLHRTVMIAAIVLSVLFLLSYIAHHLLAGDTIFGDADHNGVLSPEESALVGSTRTVYLILLLTHIPLAAVILPFILFTAYRALIGEYDRHKKLTRITWPVWFYVAVSGVIIYLMISPYYG
jgi:putative membrane protein